MGVCGDPGVAGRLPASEECPNTVTGLSSPSGLDQRRRHEKHDRDNIEAR